MKYGPLFILCLVLVATAILGVWRLPSRDFPPVFLAYLIVLLAFHFTGFLLLQGQSVQSEAYQSLYKWAQIISGVAAIGVALYVNSVHDSDVAIFLIQAAILLAVVERSAHFRHLGHDWRGQLHPVMNRISIEASVLLACAVLILSTLHANLSLGRTAVNAAFGFYMLLRSGYDFGVAYGAVRNESVWRGLNNWLPAMPGIVCLGLLCLFLITHQAEGATQEIRGQHVEHAAAYEGEQ